MMIWRRVCFLILLSLWWVFPALAQANGEAVLLGSDTTQFPLISFDILVRDDGEIQSALTSDNFLPSEPYEQLTVTPRDTQGVALAVIIDLQNGSDIAIIQDTLRAYFQNHWNEGDRAAFFLPQNNSLTTTQLLESKSDVLGAINNLRSSAENFRSAHALQSALNFLSADRQNHPHDSQQAILVGSYLFASVTDAAEGFSDAGFTLHGIAAHSNRSDAQFGFIRDAANAGGGMFVNNQGNRMTDGSGETVMPTGELAALYDIIERTRTSYRVRYRSTSADFGELRAVQMNVTTLRGENFSLNVNYHPPFLPPEVALINFNPNPERAIADGGELSNPGAEIGVLVTFPDSITRPVTRINLEVVADNNVVGMVSGSYNPAELARDASGAYVIPWDLTGYNLRGQLIRVTIRVTVEDAAGERTTVERTGSVNVAPVPPTNTIAPTNTIPPTNTREPTNTPQPSPTPIGDVVAFFGAAVAQDPGQGGNGPLSSSAITQILAFLATGVGSIIGVVVLAVLLIIASRTKPGKVVVSSVANLGKTAVFATRTAIFGRGDDGGGDNPGDETRIAPRTEKVYATLYPISDEYDPIEIIKEDFMIGKVLGFGSDATISNEYISRRHCVIRFVPKKGFMVTDQDSSNHTYVDDKEARPGRAYQLLNGSVLRLGPEVAYEFRIDAEILADLEEAARKRSSATSLAQTSYDDEGFVGRPPGKDVTQHYLKLSADDNEDEFDEESEESSHRLTRRARTVKSNTSPIETTDEEAFDERDDISPAASTSANDSKGQPPSGDYDDDDVEDDWYDDSVHKRKKK